RARHPQSRSRTDGAPLRVGPRRRTRSRSRPGVTGLGPTGGRRVMGFLRAMWRYLKRAGRAIRAILSSIGSFFAELIKTFFEGPVGALERLARKIIELLGRLLEFLRDGWLRIWQKAPRTPEDKRETPGREVLPLLAAVATVTI